MPIPYEPVVWPVGPPTDRADIPALCARLHVFLREHPHATVLCDVRALDVPDLTTVEALLRLQLAARRLRREIRLCHVPDALRLVLTLTGLHEALPTHPADG
ncbi:STAS domain-containing protein [Streptomyces sp. NPDC050636]|uniref:STAS domain-containing protein n=1 Tax=Streptomyces sp. NPDC050636 TaxID=3154510 RepID=UPI003412E522